MILVDIGTSQGRLLDKKGKVLVEHVGGALVITVKGGSDSKAIKIRTENTNKPKIRKGYVVIPSELKAFLSELSPMQRREISHKLGKSAEFLATILKSGKYIDEKILNKLSKWGK